MLPARCPKRACAPTSLFGTSIGAVNGANFVAADPDRAAELLAELWGGESLGLGVQRDRARPRAVRLARVGHAPARDRGRCASSSPTSSPATDFADLALPFHCVAASIESATAHWFSSGPLVPAVMASCAVPGLLPPVDIDGAHYFDGGLVHSIPVGRAVALGATLPCTCCMSAGSRARSPVPSRPWGGGYLVAFEIARRHRFHEEMSALLPGVRVITSCRLVPRRACLSPVCANSVIAAENR